MPAAAQFDLNRVPRVVDRKALLCVSWLDGLRWQTVEALLAEHGDKFFLMKELDYLADHRDPSVRRFANIHRKIRRRQPLSIQEARIVENEARIRKDEDRLRAEAEEREKKEEEARFAAIGGWYELLKKKFPTEDVRAAAFLAMKMARDYGKIYTILDCVNWACNMFGVEDKDRVVSYLLKVAREPMLRNWPQEDWPQEDWMHVEARSDEPTGF